MIWFFLCFILYIGAGIILYPFCSNITESDREGYKRIRNNKELEKGDIGGAVFIILIWFIPAFVVLLKKIIFCNIEKWIRFIYGKKEIKDDSVLEE